MLRAPAGAAAAHALIATAISYHDAAADVTAGGVSHVDHAGQGIGGVDGAGSSSQFPVELWSGPGLRFPLVTTATLVANSRTGIVAVRS